MNSPIQSLSWIQPGSLVQDALNETLASDSPENKFLLQIKPELFSTTLPPLSPGQLLRLDQILSACLKFHIFGKTILISLKTVLELLPDSEIQLVGGALKYVIGTEGLTNAGSQAIGKNNYEELFGNEENDDRLFLLSDIDIRIRSDDTKMEPHTHAENLVKSIVSFFGYEEDYQERLVEELNSENSPLHIDRPRFEIEGDDISNYSTLAKYKDPDLEIDFYFIKTLKNPVTIVDEDLFLSLGPYIRNRSVKLIPSGEMGNGWWAVISTIAKVIIPVKLDLSGWLRSLRRELEGNILAQNLNNKFSFITDNHKIVKYLERPILKMSPTRVMFLLNMSSFNLRTEKYNEELARIINTIECERRCNGIRGRIYQAAKKVGWTTIVALLRLILPLDHDLRWKRGHYTCNFNFPKERAISHVASLKNNQESVNALTEMLEIPFQNWGPIALFRILNSDLRELLYTEILRANPSPSVVRQIFTTLIPLELEQAFDFIQTYYEKVLENDAETLLTIEQLSEMLTMRSKNLSLAKRIELFFTVCDKAVDRQRINLILNRSARQLMATKKVEGCYRLLTLTLRQTNLVIDPEFWVESIKTFYSFFKDKKIVLGLLKQVLDRQLLSAPGIFQGQEIAFIIIAKEMVNQKDPAAGSLLLLLRSGKLNYHQESEIEKMLENIRQDKQEQDYASSNISGSFEELKNGNPAVLSDLLQKIEKLGLNNPYFERDIEELYQYISKTNIKEFQTELFLFTQRCPLSKERVTAFRMALLQHDVTHPEGLRAYQSELARHWDSHEGVTLKDFFHVNHDNETFFTNVVESLIANGKKKIATEILIKYYPTLSEVILRRLIKTLSLEILSSDVEKTSQLMTTVFTDPVIQEQLQELLIRFRNAVFQDNITNPKIEAVLRLSPNIWKLSETELSHFLPGTVRNSDRSLKARVWVWYREKYHMTMTLLNHTKKMTPLTLKIFEASKRLLDTLSPKDFPEIKSQIEPYVKSHTMIQQIMADRRIPLELITFFIDDLMHILDSFLRLTPFINENETLSIIQILLNHTRNQHLLSEQTILSHESLRVKLSKKILDTTFLTGEISDYDFGTFLAGWLVLQNLLLTTKTIQRNYCNLVIDFIKKSQILPQSYYSRIDDEILSFIAKIILKTNSVTHRKLSEEMKKKLALAYLDHPIIKNFSSKAETSIRVKATVKTLTPDEEEMLRSPFRSKAKFKQMMDQSKSMTLVSFLAVIIWISLGHLWDHLQIQNKTD